MNNQLAIFPYPVLNELDNFKNPLSENAAEYFDKSDLDYYIYEIQLNISNEYILSLISQGNAVYLVQVDCPSTFYHFHVKSSSNKIYIKFPKCDVLNKVTISCSVVAAKEIPNYSSPDFNDVYYKDLSFALDEGDVLVMFRNYYLDTKAIFVKDAKLGDYVEFRETDGDDVSIDLSDIIYITLPRSIYQNYQGVKELFDKNSAVIHSSFIMAALMKALNKIGENTNSTWAKSIAAQLKSNDKFYPGKDYILEDDDTISSIPDPFEVATKILQNPFSRMIENMNVFENSIS